MNLLGIYEELREVYGPFFPTSGKKKEGFLDKVRSRVAYYQPRIEEKCGVDLGDVRVKDNEEWLSDTLADITYKQIDEYAERSGKVPTERDLLLYFSSVPFIEALVIFPLWIYNTFHGARMRHNNNTIYVPFYYANRFVDIDFEQRKREIDYTVVHELSHNLWDVLAGNTNPRRFFGKGRQWFKDFTTYRQWFEGFATYCADKHFADFYPDGLSKVSAPRRYNEGKEEIKKLVERHGNGIVLEIPERWHEFSNSNNQSADVAA